LATATKEKAWTASKAAALARTPGTHSHPTVSGFSMMVSPKLHAVYRFGLRDAGGTLRRGAIAEVAESKGNGLSLDAAIAEFEKLRANFKTVDSGIKSKKDTLDLATAFLEWINESKKRGGGERALTTKDSYIECYSRYLEPTASTWILSEVNAEAWQTPLHAAKAKSISGARVAYWLLHAIYAYYQELDVLPSNPLAKSILRGKFAGEDTKKVRKTQVAAIALKVFLHSVLKLRNLQSRNAILVLIFTGWRLNAVMRMKWEDIDFEKGEYTVHKFAVGWKGFEGQMALNFFALTYLQEQKKLRPGETYVFPGRHGKTEHQIEVRGSLNSACVGLGFHVTAHDLRRTFATIGEVVLDGNMRLLGLLIGHKQLDPGHAVTSGYVVRNVQAERLSSRVVAEAIVEISDMLPLSDETLKKFSDRGIDLSKLTLIELEDDDDEVEAIA
jgi:integrase